MSTNNLYSFPLRRSHSTRRHGTLSPATVQQIPSQKLKTLTNAWPFRVQKQIFDASVWKPTPRMLFPRSNNFFIWYSSGPPVRSIASSLYTFSYPSTLPRYQRALQDQPRVPILPEPFDTIVPGALFALGQIFVITSTWALGITGTFLGDYFGILMDHRVTGWVSLSSSSFSSRVADGAE